MSTIHFYSNKRSAVRKILSTTLPLLLLSLLLLACTRREILDDAGAITVTFKTATITTESYDIETLHAPQIAIYGGESVVQTISGDINDRDNITFHDIHISEGVHIVHFMFDVLDTENGEPTSKIIDITAPLFKRAREVIFPTETLSDNYIIENECVITLTGDSSDKPSIDIEIEDWEEVETDIVICI